jgi:hypothetical protein
VSLTCLAAESLPKRLLYAEPLRPRVRFGGAGSPTVKTLSCYSNRAGIRWELTQQYWDGEGLGEGRDLQH